MALYLQFCLYTWGSPVCVSKPESLFGGNHYKLSGILLGFFRIKIRERNSERRLMRFSGFGHYSLVLALSNKSLMCITVYKNCLLNTLIFLIPRIRFILC